MHPEARAAIELCGCFWLLIVLIVAPGASGDVAFLIVFWLLAKLYPNAEVE